MNFEKTIPAKYLGNVNSYHFIILALIGLSLTQIFYQNTEMRKIADPIQIPDDAKHIQNTTLNQSVSKSHETIKSKVSNQTPKIYNQTLDGMLLIVAK